MLLRKYVYSKYLLSVLPNSSPITPCSFLFQNSAFSFTHLLILSRTYHLSLDDEAKLANSQSRNASSKRKKAKASNVDIPRPDDGIYSFHPEDDSIKEVRFFALLRLPDLMADNLNEMR
jgi:hypothetical protein